MYIFSYILIAFTDIHMAHKETSRDRCDYEVVQVAMLFPPYSHRQLCHSLSPLSSHTKSTSTIVVAAVLACAAHAM